MSDHELMNAVRMIEVHARRQADALDLMAGCAKEQLKVAAELIRLQKLAVANALGLDPTKARE